MQTLNTNKLKPWALTLILLGPGILLGLGMIPGRGRDGNESIGPANVVHELCEYACVVRALCVCRAYMSLYTYIFSEFIHEFSHGNFKNYILTPVNTVIASSDLVPSIGYDSRHLCQIPLTLNFGMNSTFKNAKQIRYYEGIATTQNRCRWKPSISKVHNKTHFN